MDLEKLKWKVKEPILQKRMEEAWVNDDPAGCLVAMSNMEYFDFFYMHFEYLLGSDHYEEVLFQAITMPSVNLQHIPLEDLRTALKIANRDKMRKFGDPLPGDGPFTIYRGISGKGRARRKKGISWTASLEKAKWFANRFYMEKPMVYQTTISANFVYTYSNKRKEEEFICLIPDNQKLKRVNF
jgi:hypothetical protein